MARVVLTISDAEVRFGEAPAAGVAVDPATLTDYRCQVTQAVITATANTVTVPATFCEPESERTSPSSFSLDLEGLQDWGAADPSLSEWLFLMDGETAAFGLFLDGSEDPRASGVCSVSAGDFGGPAGEVLVFSQSFPILGRPTITKADGTSIRPDGLLPIAATGATAGSPGAFTPTGATPPADLAAMTGITASPGTAWTTGQHVVLGDASQASWDGAAWEAGAAALMAEATSSRSRAKS